MVVQGGGHLLEEVDDHRVVGVAVPRRTGHREMNADVQEAVVQHVNAADDAEHALEGPQGLLLHLEALPHRLRCRGAVGDGEADLPHHVLACRVFGDVV